MPPAPALFLAKAMLPTNRADMPNAPTLIVGAGITGLTLAHALRRAGQRVTVIEAAAQTGGAIRTTREDGFLCEAGPNSMLVKAPPVRALIESVGLSEAIVPANPEASTRYIVRGGRPVAVPSGPLSAVTTPLFSFGAKLRLLGEPWRAPSPTEDESVASFVRRRLGPEFLDYAIAPMASGIYAGDPEQLSIRYAFPKVWALERRAGSLIRGTITLKRERKKSGVPPFKSQLISLLPGLQALTDRLTEGLGADLHRDAPLRALRREADGWSARWGEAEPVKFGRVVLTIAPHLWPALELEGALATAVRAVPPLAAPPVATLVLGFKREQVTHPLDGFGMLIPRQEGFPLLGSIFSSTLFPDRAPAGHVALMNFLGGMTAPEIGELDEAAAVARVLPALRSLLGITGEPVFTRHVRWPRAIPQYNVGHGAFVEALETIEGQHPGLHLQGNFRGGPGLSDCIQNALTLADALLADAS